MILIYFSFTDMCFYHRSEPSSYTKPHRPQSSNICRRCVTVCGYQRNSNKIILCTTYYHQLPSSYMRKSYRFTNIHYIINDTIGNEFVSCSRCSYSITNITLHSECYFCSQLASTIITLRKSYHEP